ncbi:MAG TPA: hypothetical protein VGK47_11345 [Nitrososphaeraceae archaeon]
MKFEEAIKHLRNGKIIALKNNLSDQLCLKKEGEQEEAIKKILFQEWVVLEVVDE